MYGYRVKDIATSSTTNEEIDLSDMPELEFDGNQNYHYTVAGQHLGTISVYRNGSHMVRAALHNAEIKFFGSFRAAYDWIEAYEIYLADYADHVNG